MNFSFYNITYGLQKLGISTNGKIRNEWLEILCPLPSHGKPDQHYGNCNIHIPTGIISCFACGGKSNIITLYKNKFGLSYSEAKKEILGAQFENFTPTYITSKKTKKISSYSPKNFVFIDLSPQNYYYTRLRGFSPEFCLKFGIKHCVSEPFVDFLFFPITSEKYGIEEYEFRKLMEYEYLEKYYKENLPFHKLKEKFEKEKKETKKEIFEKQLFINPYLWYLFKNKVFYSPGSKIKNILWNIDNLDFFQDLYVTEGLGSIPKIYTHITTNVTATFGAQISEAQKNLLSKFKRIIHLPDFDSAGYNSVKSLSQYFQNSGFKGEYFIKVLEVEDTDPNYVKKIKATPNISSLEYLQKYWKLCFFKKN